jgi:MoxR-like ATPase
MSPAVSTTPSAKSLPPLSAAAMIELIGAAFKADLPLFIWGEPGIGKSAFVRQAAEKQGWTEEAGSFVDVRLSQLEPVDLRGLPVPDQSTTPPKTNWLPPAWLPFEGSAGADAGVLFLDEASSAPPSVQAAAYQLVLDRQLGEAKVKAGWRLILAGNRVTDGGVAFRLAKPLANRMLHVETKAQLADWTAWALDSRNDVHLDVIGFLQAYPNLLSTFEEAKDAKEVAFATPRSWEMVSKILQKTKLGQDVLEAMIAGAVGVGVAVQFNAYRALKEELPNTLDIIAGKTAKCSDKRDVCYATTIALASHVIEAGDKDLQRAQDISQHCIAWLDKELKGDCFTMLFVNIVRRKRPLYLHGPTHTEWMRKHPGLFKEVK